MTLAVAAIRAIASQACCRTAEWRRGARIRADTRRATRYRQACDEASPLWTLPVCWIVPPSSAPSSACPRDKSEIQITSTTTASNMPTAYTLPDMALRGDRRRGSMRRNRLTESSFSPMTNSSSGSRFRAQMPDRSNKRCGYHWCGRHVSSDSTGILYLSDKGKGDLDRVPAEWM